MNYAIKNRVHNLDVFVCFYKINNVLKYFVRYKTYIIYGNKEMVEDRKNIVSKIRFINNLIYFKIR